MTDPHAPYWSSPQFPELPKPVEVDADAWVRCPWCGSDMDGAQVGLEQLATAWTSLSTIRPYRSPAGQADPNAAQVCCPNCQRPSMIQLKAGDGGDFRFCLIPIRTRADAAVLGETEPPTW